VSSPIVGSSPRFDEAVRAWRRSVGTTDSIAAATAISEALEFYAAKVCPPAKFSAEQIRQVRAAITAVPLDKEQRQRLEGLLAMANQPPFLATLRHALTADGVPFTDEEMEAIRRVRNARNDFVHGKSRAEPGENDLEIARAVTNRALVYWAKSRRVPTDA